MPIVISLTVAACLAASLFDIRTRRIPNVLTGSLALAAAVVHLFGGLSSLETSLGIMAVLSVFGALVYGRGGIGGGDIKLAVAGSGMLSYPLCVPFLLYTAIAGGVLAIIVLLIRPGARPSLSRLLLTAAGGSQIVSKRVTVPYAVAFALGAIAVGLSQSVLPFLRLS